MIPLVAPTITSTDRGHLYDRIDAGLLADEIEVSLFEESFAARVNCAHAVAVCSGTTAVQLALAALGLRAVSIPTYGCVALRNAATAAGCGIRLVDSSYDVAAATLTQAAQTETRAQIVMHAFGNPTVWTGTGPTIEDYTLSLGAVPELRGDLGVCSTHASKMISTGRGGVVFGNDKALLDRVRWLACYDDVNPAREGSQSLGMGALAAALGVSQLEQLDAFIFRRRDLAGRYSYKFQLHGIECPALGTGSVFFRYLIRVTNPAAKVKELAKRGIEAGRGVYQPLHRLVGLPFDDRYQGAVDAVNNLLSVPCHPSITDEQADYIAEQVVEVCAP